MKHKKLIIRILVYLLLAVHDLQAWMEQYETEIMFQEQVAAFETCWFYNKTISGV